MNEERRIDIRVPTSTLEVENMISLYFQLCYEDIVCLLGNHAGGECSLHATFHGEKNHTYISGRIHLIEKVSSELWTQKKGVKNMTVT